MQTERQRRIREVFDAASGQPAQAQMEFVRRACLGEPDIEEAVLRLLGAGRKSGAFLEKPVRGRAEPALRDGVRIGSYRVIRELGSGGMGLVYLAERADDVYHRVSAVKVIRPEYKSPALVRRFEKEREILARLDHPNIARIVDGGATAEGLPYFVMDYVNGVPIDVFCRQRNANLQQRLNLFRQACGAVDYLHTHRVVHRDLKPANILVTSEGVVKLVDFGIAKALDHSTGKTLLTVPLMTPGYASPEQLRGAPTGPPSDIYSLGAVLYELLTGARPYDFGESPTPEMIRVVSHEEPIKPSTRVLTGPLAARGSQDWRGHLKGDLDCVVLMALRKEPERRYASAAELSADIERFQFQRPVAARGTSLVYRVTRFFQRRRKAVVAAALIAAMLSGVTWEAAKIHYQHELQQLHESQEQLLQNDRQRQGANGLSSGQLQTDLHQVSENYGGQFRDLRLVSNADRRSLVDQGLTYLQQVAPEAQQSEGTAAALARAYLAIAQAQQSYDAAGAIETCETALGALGSAVEKYPDSDEIKQMGDAIGQLLRRLAAPGQGPPSN